MAITGCPFCSQLQAAGDGLVEVVGYLTDEPAIEEVPVPDGIGRSFRQTTRKDSLRVRGCCVGLGGVKGDQTLIIWAGARRPGGRGRAC